MENPTRARRRKPDTSKGDLEPLSKGLSFAVQEMGVGPSDWVSGLESKPPEATVAQWPW